jgi:hypothetical protein
VRPDRGGLVTDRRWALRHYCVNRDLSGLRMSHTYGNGVPKRVTCRLCYGKVVTEQGMWGVFLWSADNRYPPQDARSQHVIETIAQRHRDKGRAKGLDLVVRWIPKDQIDPGPAGQPCVCTNLAGDCDGDHTAAGESDPLRFGRML